MSSFSISQPDALVDAPIQAHLQGLAPNQTVRVEATVDAWRNQSWASHVVVSTDENGEVDLARAQPLSGTYDAPDAMGLFWSLKPTGRTSSDPAPDHPEGVSPLVAPIRVRLTARHAADPSDDTSAEGERGVVAETKVTRRYVGADVQVESFRGESLTGCLYHAEAATGPVILVLGGSEGGIPHARAAVLASRGFSSLALGYFGAAPLPSALVDIPIEYVYGALDLLHERYPDRRVTLLGTSRGAELALIVAARRSDVHGVAAYVPSAFVQAGHPPTGGRAAAWTENGSALPAGGNRFTSALWSMVAAAQGVDPADTQPHPGLAQGVGTLFWSATNPDAAAQCTIPVRDINGPVWIASGADDRLWPATLHGALIQAWRGDQPTEHHVFDRAGHHLVVPYAPAPTPTWTYAPGVVLNAGGTRASNAAASAEAWPKLLQFLASL